MVLTDDFADWFGVVYDFVTKCASVQRGPLAQVLYTQQEHATTSGNVVMTRYWAPFEINADEFAGGPLAEFWENNKFKLLAKMANTADERPRLSPNPNLFAFANGWLDFEKGRFFGHGWPATTNIFERDARYKVAVNFFAFDFDTEGFDQESGDFDWTNRLPEINPTTKWVDWKQSLMPSKHWSREAQIPVIETAIDTQEWDLHTVQTLYLSLARCIPASNALETISVSFAGAPGTGKSMLASMALAPFPSDRVLRLDNHLNGVVMAVDPSRPFDPIPLTEHPLIATADDISMHALERGLPWVCDTPKSGGLSSTPRHPEPSPFEPKSFGMSTVFATNVSDKELRKVFTGNLWTFKLKNAPKRSSNNAANNREMHNNMPAYLRRTTIVMHEFLKLVSIAEKVHGAKRIAGDRDLKKRFASTLVQEDVPTPTRSLTRDSMYTMYADD